MPHPLLPAPERTVRPDALSCCDPDRPDADAGREFSGWFESSLDLKRGLLVIERPWPSSVELPRRVRH